MRLRRALVFAVTLLVLLVAPQRASLRAATGDVLPFKATETTLPNGLKVIVVPTGFPNIVSLHATVQTGSRNEVEPGKSGFAHFFEHLMFRGTPAFPPRRAEEIKVKAGARDNASTGDDFTRYFVTFAKEDLDIMLQLYADMFRNLQYDEAAFRTEAGAILGEYNKNVANPYEKLIEVQRERAFTTHTYKHTTMGFLRDIEDMPNQYEYSKVFFDRWYRPQFTTVIVAGDVTPETALPLVEKYWGGWQKTTPTPKVDIPREPPPSGPIYAHVPWTTQTLPIVSVAWRAPAFSETEPDYAAMDMVASLYFGPTSRLYRQLVVEEQKVDQMFVDNPGNMDPALFTVFARLKAAEDAVYVRDRIMEAAALARAGAIHFGDTVRALTSQRLDEAKSNNRYSFLRTLDSTDRIAAVVAQYAPYSRSYHTVNHVFRVLDGLGPGALQAAARKYFTDAGLVVTTLSHQPLPEGVATLPAIDTFKVAREEGLFAGAVGTLPVPGVAAGAKPDEIAVLAQKSPLPQLNVKLMFAAGSAHDPKGKEGLSALAAAMIAEAGSRGMTIDQARQLLYPIAGSFTAQVDREATTFTGSIHRDNWQRFFEVALNQLVDPGYRPEDFTRLKAAQMNALVQDLRSDNEEELGKERLQANVFAGTPYASPTLGTVAGIEAITIDDVKQFVAARYTRAALRAGVNGDAPDVMLASLRAALTNLPAGQAPVPTQVSGRMPQGLEVEIVEKDTRSTAISFGHPIGVTRAHPDFAALSVARAWLGEHRASSGRLFQRIREVRGFNYGNYAYIEAFPRGMYQFFPDPNLPRRAQVFEVWIRPVMPQHAHMALRIALHELQALIDKGLSQEDFESTRDYLMKNVFVITARQGHQLGYALDSEWYGIGDFPTYMRERLATLTRDEVNAAISRHLSATNVSVVMITRDAAALRDALVSDARSVVTYESEKPKELLEEDKIIGSRKLNVSPGKVRITPVAEVFAK